MRERAASVGGELSAGPLPGGGFRVQAMLPTAGRPAGDVLGEDVLGEDVLARASAGREGAS
jgi:hypothetical protein